MKTILWLLRIVVFVLLFGLAVKNSNSVELRFFFNTAAQWPLSLVLLTTFVAGTVVGISAAFATLIRQRREIGRLRQSSGDTTHRD
jgi:putative membrane protein